MINWKFLCKAVKVIYQILSFFYLLLILFFFECGCWWLTQLYIDTMLHLKTKINRRKEWIFLHEQKSALWSETCFIMETSSSPPWFHIRNCLYTQDIRIRDTAQIMHASVVGNDFILCCLPVVLHSAMGMEFVLLEQSTTLWICSVNLICVSPMLRWIFVLCWLLWPF